MPSPRKTPTSRATSGRRPTEDPRHLARPYPCPSRARARAMAARTWAGAVPPMWSRAATEPSRVRTAKTSASIRGEKPRSSSRVMSGQVAPLAHPEGDRLADDLMGVAEGDAPAHQIVRQVGGGGEALAGGGAHALAPAGQGPHHVGEDLERALEVVHGVEQRLLVLLVVLVVGQRLALHQGQQARSDGRRSARSCRAPVRARPGSSSAA